MNEFFAGSATIGVVISLIFYFFGIWLKEKFKSSLINPLLISIDRLVEQGYLLLHPEERYEPENPEQVDYPKVREHKMKLLRESHHLRRSGAMNGAMTPPILMNT